MEVGGVNLFIAPSLLNHSCAPSCFWESDEENQFQLMTCGVAAGEEISISYLASKELDRLTVPERRDTLAIHWLFFCLCKCCTAVSPMPLCSQCSGQYDVFLSFLHENPYGEFDVDCSACDLQNVEVHHGYYLHCTKCEHDLCPGCAHAAAEAQGLCPSKPGVDAAALV